MDTLDIIIDITKKDDHSILRITLNLEVSGKRKRWQSKRTWKGKMKEQTDKTGLKMKDTQNQVMQ